MNAMNIESLNIELSKTKRINLSISLSTSIIYIITMIFGILKYLNPVESSSQALLIIAQSLFGACIPLIFFGIEKIFSMKIHFGVKIAIIAYSFLAIVLGEGFNFYYLVTWWDAMLHVLSGVWISMVGFFIVLNLTKSYRGAHRVFICLSVTAMISFSVAFIWEIYEFSFDSIFGTNMQKFIPEIADLFNGGSSKEALEATDEAIAQFYRTSYGYRYALIDTMQDMLCCLGGTAFVILVFFGCFKAEKINIFENTIEFKKKNSYSEESILD